MSNLEIKVEEIFPTPTLHTLLPRQFTQAELEHIDAVSKYTTKNTGNWTSKDRKVLDHPAMAGLREHVMEVVQYWFANIAMNTEVEPYITQSWLNYTRKGEAHHRHKHPNSYLSGVLYISSDNDKICFDKNEYEQIRVQPLNEKDWNKYNSDVAWFGTPPGKIVVFPSSVYHYVDTKETEGLRVSLAFNVFVKGTLGKDTALTELIL